MATAAKLFLGVLFFFFFLVGANCQGCGLSSVVVLISSTGKKAGGDPVFEVEIKNTCHCTVTDVFLWSEGFSSSTPWDHRMFRREGAGYLVNDGKGIASSLSVKFSYAWDRAFRMHPSALQVSCQTKHWTSIDLIDVETS